ARRASRNQSARRRTPARRNQLHRSPAVRCSRVECNRQQRMIVENPISRPHHRFPIALRIPRKSKSRRHIVHIARNSFHHSQRTLRRRIHRRRRREIGRQLHVIPHAVIQSQLPIHPPAILRKKRKRIVIKRLIRLP